MLIPFAIIVAVIAGFCAGAIITQRQMNNFKGTIEDIRKTVTDIYDLIPTDAWTQGKTPDLPPEIADKVKQVAQGTEPDGKQE
ncbi:hypothetical protein HED96_000619 [Salmonella enterica]|nr:hypothetical protein [Salmonella enterica]EBW7254749.1 hypothetical protein [Salmonella enterica subsp. enterica serovar Gatow]EBZ0384849.1 hypothetical protein [Salmonella enterica subsp. enterica serovar Oranienburg]HCM6305239.1 hypothetical protein [Salmonella enterica subsp. enterica serovar 6,14:y:1,7]EEU7747291.1 hypothetical protein [Salmonella enterica]